MKNVDATRSKAHSGIITRLDKDSNAFAPGVKRVRTRIETRLSKDLNAFTPRMKRVPSACETRFIYTLRLTGNVPRSTELGAFAACPQVDLGPLMVWIELRSIENDKRQRSQQCCAVGRVPFC